MLDKIPEAITAASNSFIGPFALGIIVISLVAYVFFRSHSSAVKGYIFFIVCLMVLLLAVTPTLVDKYFAQEQKPNLHKPSENVLMLERQASQNLSVGNIQKVEEIYNELAQLHRKTGDLRSAAYALLFIGDLAANQNNQEKALNFYNQAEALAVSVDDSFGASNARLRANLLTYVEREKQLDAIEDASSSHPSGNDRNNLVSYVASHSALSEDIAASAVDATFEGITQFLANGREVRLFGFGTFAVVHRTATSGRNPRTGEEILIPESWQPKFKAGKALKDAVQQ
jgi:DNA-binding protein HU-beta